MNDPSNPFFSSNNNNNNNKSSSNNTEQQQQQQQQISDINSFFSPLQESFHTTTSTTSSSGTNIINHNEGSDLLIDPIIGQNIINNTISKFLQFNNLSKQQQQQQQQQSYIATPNNNFLPNNSVATIANMNNNNNNQQQQQQQIPQSLFQSLQRSPNTFQNNQQQQQQQQQPQQFNTPSPNSSSPFPLMNNSQQPYPQSSSPFNFTPLSNNNQRTGSNQSSVSLLASILANQNFAVPQQQQQQPQQQQIASPASNNQQIQNLITKMQSLESEIQNLKQENARVKGELSDFASSFVEFKNNFLGRTSSGLGVIITSGDTGKILSANSCVLKLLGYDDLEHFRSSVGKWSDVVVQEDRQRVFSTFLQSALSSNDNCFIVFRAKRVDGKIITVSSNHVVAYDDGGENPFFSMSFFKQLDVPPEDNTSEQSK